MSHSLISFSQLQNRNNDRINGCRAAADATLPHTAPGAGAGALRFTSILLATLLAFKVVPGTVISDDTFAGQSDEDWSANYAQFGVRHAVSHLGNHYDRGHSVASLEAITTRRELPLCMCSSAAFRDGGIDGATKAAMLRRALAEQGQSLGEGPTNEGLRGAARRVPDRL